MAFTIYNNPPVVLAEYEVANATMQTTGTQEYSGLAIPKGIRVVDCWVNIDTAAGASGAGTLFTETGTTEIALLTVAEVNTAGMEGTRLTSMHDVLSADGNLKFRKTGTGDAIVFSYSALLVRPDMNPA